MISFVCLDSSYAAEAKESATLAEMIINLLRLVWQRSILANAGADANENTVKIAKNVYRQKQIIQPLQKLSRFFIPFGTERQPYGRAEDIP